MKALKKAAPALREMTALMICLSVLNTWQLERYEPDFLGFEPAPDIMGYGIILWGFGAHMGLIEPRTPDQTATVLGIGCFPGTGLWTNLS